MPGKKRSKVNTLRAFSTPQTGIFDQKYHRCVVSTDPGPRFADHQPNGGIGDNARFVVFKMNFETLTTIRLPETWITVSGSLMVVGGYRKWRVYASNAVTAPRQCCNNKSASARRVCGLISSML